MNARKNPTISILIPCYNEEKTIERCLFSWLNQTRPADEIIIVNDCSTDGTLEILEKYRDWITIINLPKNTGNKSFVQEEGLKHIKTDVFIATDADTLMDENFVQRVFEAFGNEKVQAFSGYVKSLKQNWLTACREIEYLIGQDLHKIAQEKINFFFVIPGCAGAFRTGFFKENVSFDHDTLTEDLDFTYKINKQNFKIFYDRQAIVYTQDPDNMASYINQMRRWYSGGWQNLKKHIGIVKSPWKALELSVVYIEGLIFYPVMLAIPFINLKFFYFFLLNSLLTGAAFGLYGAAKRKRRDLLLAGPAYVLLAYVNAYIFMEQFIKEIILKRKNLVWFHPERRQIA